MKKLMLGLMMAFAVSAEAEIILKVRIGDLTYNLDTYSGHMQLLKALMMGESGRASGPSGRFSEYNEAKSGMAHGSILYPQRPRCAGVGKRGCCYHATQRDAAGTVFSGIGHPLIPNFGTLS